MYIGINKEDMLIIKEIFNGKELFRDNPSCGFDENISLCFDNITFSVACDGCPIIKYKNKYFYVSEIELEQIHNIMENMELNSRAFKLYKTGQSIKMRDRILCFNYIYYSLKFNLKCKLPFPPVSL